MSDFTEKLIIDDSQALKALGNVSNAANQAGAEFQKLQDTTVKTGQAIGTEVKSGQEKATKAVKETTAEISRQNSAFGEAIRNTKVFGVSLNDIKDKLTLLKSGLSDYRKNVISSSKEITVQSDASKKLTTAMMLKEKAIKGVIVASKALKVALVSTGIGALVVALGSLIAFFSKTEEGADKLQRAGAALGIIFTKLTDFAAKLGGKLVDAFSNPKQAITDLVDFVKDQIINRFTAIPALFVAIGKSIKEGFSGNIKGAKEALTDAGQAVVQFTTGFDSKQQDAFFKSMRDGLKEIKEAVKETDKLTLRKQALEDANIAFIATQGKLNKALAEARNISRDESKSLTERIEAAKKADQIEKQLTAERLRLARENYAIIKKTNEQSYTMDKDREKEMQALADVYAIEEESAMKRIRMNSTLNKLIQEQADLFNGMRDEITELAKATGVISEADQFELVKAEQLKTLRDYVAKLKEMAVTLKMDVGDSLDQAEQIIEGMTQRVFQKEIKPIEVKVKGITFTPTKPPEYKPKEKGTIKIDDVFDIENISDFESLLIETLDVLFDKAGKITEEEWGEFLKGVSSLIGEFSAIANEATDIQLEQIDKQLDALDKRKDKLQDGLEREQELYKKGLANNLSTKQQEVDGLIAEETRLLAQKEKLQNEAQKRQLAFDTVSQASSLITSSIQIIKGFTAIGGPIGTALGIAAVAALFGWFAKVKVDAFNATKLSTGADRIDDYFGFGDRHGNTDLHGGKGYRLVNEANGKPTNVIISGREMLIPEMVSLKQEAFFNKLKAGAYDGIDLASSIDIHKRFSNNVVVVNEKKERIRQFIPGKNGKYHLVTITPDMKDGTTIEIQ